jgi:hypothetical protein
MACIYTSRINCPCARIKHTPPASIRALARLDEKAEDGVHNGAPPGHPAGWGSGPGNDARRDRATGRPGGGHPPLNGATQTPRARLVQTAKVTAPSSPVRQVGALCIGTHGQCRDAGRCAGADRLACDLKKFRMPGVGANFLTHALLATKTCIRAPGGTDAFTYTHTRLWPTHMYT